MLDLDRLCINSFFLILINLFTGFASVQVWLKMWTLCAICMIKYSSLFYQKKKKRYSSPTSCLQMLIFNFQSWNWTQMGWSQVAWNCKSLTWTEYFNKIEIALRSDFGIGRVCSWHVNSFFNILIIKNVILVKKMLRHCSVSHISNNTNNS